MRAFTYRLRYGLGFNDATNVAIMERKNISKLYSFDKVFDNVPWLKRDEA
ncbi:MAG: PIN domain-containing protein [Candidatus Bathyarchaeia archaeon]